MLGVVGGGRAAMPSGPVLEDLPFTITLNTPGAFSVHINGGMTVTVNCVGRGDSGVAGTKAGAGSGGDAGDVAQSTLTLNKGEVFSSSVAGTGSESFTNFKTVVAGTGGAAETSGTVTKQGGQGAAGGTA